MVKFDISRTTNRLTEIGNLYAIYGEDHEGRIRLLVVGYPETAMRTEVPVIDLTCPLQTCQYYDKGTAPQMCATTLALTHRQRGIQMTTPLLLLYSSMTKGKIENLPFSVNLD